MLFDPHILSTSLQKQMYQTHRKEADNFPQ